MIEIIYTHDAVLIDAEAAEQSSREYLRLSATERETYLRSIPPEARSLIVEFATEVDRWAGGVLNISDVGKRAEHLQRVPRHLYELVIDQIVKLSRERK